MPAQRMKNPAATQIADYTKTIFTAETREGHSVSHDIYRRGSGAPVVLIQELPGIGQETLALADRLIGAGFEVIMPHLLVPAYKAAINGFPVNERYLKGANYKKEWLKKYKETEAIFLDKGEVPKKGWILKQTDLAKTIKKIMKGGHKSFYTGSFAKKMVESVQNNGGIWSEEDLNRYKDFVKEVYEALKDKERLSIIENSWMLTAKHLMSKW